MDAGRAVTFLELKRDIYGKSYVDDRTHVSGKRLNADLKRLGY